MVELHVWSDDGDFMGGITIHGKIAELWDMDGNVDGSVNVSGLHDESLWDVVLNAYSSELGIDDSELYLTDINDAEILWAP